MPTWDEYKKTMTVEDSIFEAAKKGDFLTLSDYLKKGGEVEARDSRGSTPLMLAAYYDQLEVSEILISAGADVNACDQHGNTVLMGVAFKGHVRIVELLLQNSADPHLYNPHGMKALDFAKAFGRKDVVEILSDERFSLLDQVSSFAKVISQTLRPW